ANNPFFGGQSTNRVTDFVPPTTPKGCDRKIGKLSVIFSGRNDNYSADFKTRVQAALQRNQAEAAARNLDVEWLVAEWNPTNEDYLGYHLAGVKSYVANPRLHTQVISPSVAEHVSFLQFFAKNIAIRRATGDWILVTNADC